MPTGRHIPIIRGRGENLQIRGFVVKVIVFCDVVRIKTMRTNLPFTENSPMSGNQSDMNIPLKAILH